MNATLTLLPVLLFLVLQGKILPYQNTFPENEYRLLILAEAIVVFWAFSEYWKSSGKALWLMILAMGTSFLISVGFMTSNPKHIASGYWDKWGSVLPWSPILNPGNRDFVDDEVVKVGEGIGIKILENRSFVGAKLDYADLRKINLFGSDFRYAKLLRARMDEAILKKSDFSGANLEGASFQAAAMDDSRFWGANLHKADFSGADLKRSDLHGANLEHGNFDGSNIKKARLIGANLRHARFIGANLKDAIFMGSYLSQVSFIGAELKRAKLQNVILAGSEMLKKLMISSCRINPNFDGCSVSEIHFASNLARYDIKSVRRFDKNFLGAEVQDRKNKKRFFLFYSMAEVSLDTLKKNFEEEISEKMQMAQNIGKDLNVLKDEKPAKMLKIPTDVKFTEALATDLYCNARHTHGYLDKVGHILADTEPDFSSANLTEVEFVQDHKKTMDEYWEEKSVRTEGDSFVVDDLSPSSHFWSNDRREKSDSYKLEVAGCRDVVAARLDSEAMEVFEFPEMFNKKEELQTIMCTAGTYPHVANTIAMSGRLLENSRSKDIKRWIKEAEKDIKTAHQKISDAQKKMYEGLLNRMDFDTEKKQATQEVKKAEQKIKNLMSMKKRAQEYIMLARNILVNRCSKSCPGANDLHPHAVSELWNIAINDSGYETDDKSEKNYDKFEKRWPVLDSLPYKRDGVPAVMINCDAWKAFLKETVQTKNKPATKASTRHDSKGE